MKEIEEESNEQKPDSYISSTRVTPSIYDAIKSLLDSGGHSYFYRLS
jgi:hypothetical protein